MRARGTRSPVIRHLRMFEPTLSLSIQSVSYFLSIPDSGTHTMATTTQQSPVSGAKGGQNTSGSPPVRRFTVAEYHTMGDIGVLSEDERLELIHGQIFHMSPIGSLHAKVVNRLNKMLHQIQMTMLGLLSHVSMSPMIRREDEHSRLSLFTGFRSNTPNVQGTTSSQDHLASVLSQRLYQTSDHDVMLSVQNPVALSETSEPEPDLAVLTSEGPPGRHPTPDDILLILEVADTSLEHDRNRKMPLYAAAGIPEYWLVNLNETCIDVHREPDGDTYARRIRHRPGDTLNLAAFPDLAALPVRDIFPEHSDKSAGT